MATWNSVSGSSRLAALIVLTGSALLLSRLGSQSLWIDEGLTVAPVLQSHSLRELASLVQQFDTQPPGSHALLYVLQSFLPASEFFLRLPSLIAVEAALVVLYLLVSRLWNAKTGLAFLAAAQVSPLLGFYAMEARNYGLWLFASAASWYVYVAFLDAAVLSYPARKRACLAWALAWGTANAASLWIHIFHVFVPAAQVVIAAIIWTQQAEHPTVRRRLITLGLLAQTVTLILFVPWTIRLIEEFVSGQAGVPWTREFTVMNVPYYLFAAHFGMSFGPNLADLHVKPLAVLFSEHPAALILGGGAVLATVAAYLRLVLLAASNVESRWKLLAFVVAPATIAGPMIVYGAAFDFPLHIRHLLIVWPLLPLVLAIALTRLKWGRAYYATVLVLQAYALAGLLFNGYYWKDDARGAVRFAEQTSNGAAYVLGDIASYYVTTARAATRSSKDFDPSTDDVWILDNRRWELQNVRDVERIANTLQALGLEQTGHYGQFHGIDLIHWERVKQ